MSKNSLVSVIIIFLNEAKFIQEAIASVFAQTYESWELILVDDGSTDVSSEIARNCAQDYREKVRYLDHAGHQNRGMSASRNLGVTHAAGEYIAFLDADDVWVSCKLEQQMRIMTLHPEAAMVFGASRYWYSWTGDDEDFERDYVPDLGMEADTLVRPPTLLTLFLESKARTPGPSDMLLRREIVQRVGSFEERFKGIYQLYEDQAFLAKVYLNAPVFVSKTCWGNYRQHANSCVSLVKKAGKKYTAGLFYLDWLEEHLRAHGVENGELWQALRKKRWQYRHPKLHGVVETARHRVRQVINLG